MAAENALKSREVSTMIKQGFISDPTISFSPSRSISKFYSPLSSPSKTLSSPPPSISASTQSQTQALNRQTHAQIQSQTLYEMMSDDQKRESKFSEDKRRKVQERVLKVLNEAPFRKPNWGGFQSDVRLTVVARDGFKVSMDVHKSVLGSKSRFFAEKLRRESGFSHSVEISDCDDVDVYVETVVLMYCEYLKQKLIGEDVSKVLGLLKVSAALMFEEGIMSCLEYLEAVPWSEEEEEKVVSHLSQLQLDVSVDKLLLRVSCESSTSSQSDDVFLRLLTGVLQAKDEKARHEMKALISKLLREDTPYICNRIEISKDTLYHLCHKCLSSLILCLSDAACVDDSRRDRGVLMGEIAREADNMHWIVDILVQQKMGDDFVNLWAEQKELVNLHSKIPIMYRHEISRITAQLCVDIGRGHILVPKETRYMLLSTWLEALYEDFGWMKRASRYVDKKLVEEGLGRTILTLPMPQQQSIMLNWFERFLHKGDDCPNIHRAFEVWWRRAFVRGCALEPDSSQLQLAVCDHND